MELYRLALPAIPPWEHVAQYTLFALLHTFDSIFLDGGEIKSDKIDVRGKHSKSEKPKDPRPSE